MVARNRLIEAKAAASSINARSINPSKRTKEEHSSLFVPASSPGSGQVADSSFPPGPAGTAVCRKNRTRTVSPLRLQTHPAALAVIEELAGIRRHRLSRLVTAGRARNGRCQDHANQYGRGSGALPARGRHCLFTMTQPADLNPPLHWHVWPSVKKHSWMRCQRREPSPATITALTIRRIRPLLMGYRLAPWGPKRARFAIIPGEGENFCTSGNPTPALTFTCGGHSPAHRHDEARHFNNATRGPT
jgi:hypothetical protein